MKLMATNTLLVVLLMQGKVLLTSLSFITECIVCQDLRNAQLVTSQCLNFTPTIHLFISNLVHVHVQVSDIHFGATFCVGNNARYSSIMFRISPIVLCCTAQFLPIMLRLYGSVRKWLKYRLTILAYILQKRLTYSNKTASCLFYQKLLTVLLEYIDLFCDKDGTRILPIMLGTYYAQNYAII